MLRIWPRSVFCCVKVCQHLFCCFNSSCPAMVSSQAVPATRSSPLTATRSTVSSSSSTPPPMTSWMKSWKTNWRRSGRRLMDDVMMIFLTHYNIIYYNQALRLFEQITIIIPASHPIPHLFFEVVTYLRFLCLAILLSFHLWPPQNEQKFWAWT